MGILSDEKQQLNVIKTQAITRLSIVDLNLVGNDVSSDETFVKVGYGATKNKVLFWLNLNLGDVVRSTNSSPLMRLLGRGLNNNADQLEDEIRDSFTENFSAENIFLADCKLIANKETRSWFLTMSIIDNVSDSLIPINMEITQ